MTAVIGACGLRARVFRLLRRLIRRLESSPKWSLVLVAFASAPASVAILGQFLWTDTAEIVERGLVSSGGSDLLGALTDGIEDHYYRPTVFVVHSLNSWLLGSTPLAFRSVNFLLHLANALVLHLVVRALTPRLFVSLGCALLFAVHPVAVTTISWASDRTDLIALGAALGVVLLAVRFASRPTAGNLAVTLGVLLVGLGAKENAGACVVILGFLAWRTSAGAERRRLLILLGAASATCVIWFCWREHLSSNPVGVGQQLPLLVRGALAAKIHVGYVSELAAPWTLRVCDDVAVPARLWPWLSLAVLGCGAIAALVVRYRNHTAGLGLVWTLAFLLPSAGLLMTLKHARADRYLYAPLPGLLLVGVVALRRLPARFRVPAALAAYALSVVTIRRTEHFAPSVRAVATPREGGPQGDQDCREHRLGGRQDLIAREDQGAVPWAVRRLIERVRAAVDLDGNVRIGAHEGGGPSARGRRSAAKQEAPPFQPEAAQVVP